MTLRPATADRRRRGFTLVELLVVIAIIALLSSMALVVYGRVGENARIAGTKTLIKQLDSNLQERMEALRRYDFGPLAQSFFRYSGTQQQYEPVAWLKKATYKSEFPQRFQDLYGFDNAHGDSTPSQQRDNSPLWAIVKKRHPPINPPTPNTSDDLAQINPATNQPYVSSAELLYLALTEASSYGLPPLDLDQINGRYVVDEDQDGLPEFVDGWGKPLRFYNFPTALLRPSGNSYDEFPSGGATATGQPISRYDYQNARILNRALPPLPVDTGGVVRDIAWDDYDHPLNIDSHDYLGVINVDRDPTDNDKTNEDRFERNWHSRNTYFAPLIVSSGPDEALGMYEPHQTTFDAGDDHADNNTTVQVNNQLYRLGMIKLDPTATTSSANPRPAHQSVFDNLTNYQRGGF
jgi:prepilin-type N-terminal cleavage/methylation domain-containing protein